MTDELEAHLYGAHIGTLRRASDGVQFTASAEAIEAFGLNSKILSAGLPLNPAAQDATAFVGGLLPEGPALANLRRQIPAADRDVFGLISRVGRDVAGAVTFGDATGAEPRYIPVTDTEIAHLLDAAATLPLGRLAGGSSLTGFQRKITLARRDGRWHDRDGGAPSTHILKPVTPDHEPAVQAEGYTLALGRHMGLLSNDSYVTKFDGRPTLVIERYDRTVGADGTVSRIHQEDSAQALGLTWSEEAAKFQQEDGVASHRLIASLLPGPKSVFDTATPQLDQLLRYITFNIAVGNTDAHAKNFSLLHQPDGTITLAPLYDVAPQALGYDGHQTLALWVDDVRAYADVTTADIVAEATSWGLETEHARQVVIDTLYRLEAAVQQTDAHHTIAATVPGYILGQTYNLLSGNPGRLNLPHPLGLLPGIPLPERPSALDPMASTAH